MPIPGRAPSTTGLLSLGNDDFLKRNHRPPVFRYLVEKPEQPDHRSWPAGCQNKEFLTPARDASSEDEDATRAMDGRRGPTSFRFAARNKHYIPRRLPSWTTSRLGGGTSLTAGTAFLGRGRAVTRLPLGNHAAQVRTSGPGTSGHYLHRQHASVPVVQPGHAEREDSEAEPRCGNGWRQLLAANLGPGLRLGSAARPKPRAVGAR